MQKNTTEQWKATHMWMNLTDTLWSERGQIQRNIRLYESIYMKSKIGRVVVPTGGGLVGRGQEGASPSVVTVLCPNVSGWLYGQICKCANIRMWMPIGPISNHWSQGVAQEPCLEWFCLYISWHGFLWAIIFGQGHVKRCLNESPQF